MQMQEEQENINQINNKMSKKTMQERLSKVLLMQGLILCDSEKRKGS